MCGSDGQELTNGQRGGSDVPGVGVILLLRKLGPHVGGWTWADPGGGLCGSA